MKSNTTLSLARLYDLFKDPAFVRKHCVMTEENGVKMFTGKAEVAAGQLGNVTLDTALYPRLNVAIPVMLLTERQVRILRENGIHFLVKRRDNPKDDHLYIGFPRKNTLERIDKLIASSLP